MTNDGADQRQVSGNTEEPESNPANHATSEEAIIDVDAPDDAYESAVSGPVSITTQPYNPVPTQSVTDQQAIWMTRVGVVLISVSVLFAGAAVVRLYTEHYVDTPPQGAGVSQTIGFYLPVLMGPILMLAAALLISVIGYLLMRSAYAAASEIIPTEDRAMVTEILSRMDPKEATNEYVRLRSLTGVSGFFTKMKLSGLPLATISLTLVFTFLAIWSDAFFDLAKLTLGVFLGSYVQQNVGPERQA